MCDLPNSKGAELAKELNTPDVIFAATDITKEDDVEKAMKTVKDAFGRLDLAVNVAGVHYVSKLYDDKKKALHALDLMEKVKEIKLHINDQDFFWYFSVNCVYIHKMQRQMPLHFKDNFLNCFK